MHADNKLALAIEGALDCNYRVTLTKTEFGDFYGTKFSDFIVCGVYCEPIKQTWYIKSLGEKKSVVYFNRTDALRELLKQATAP